MPLRGYMLFEMEQFNLRIVTKLSPFTKHGRANNDVSSFIKLIKRNAQQLHAHGKFCWGLVTMLSCMNELHAR